MSWSGIGSRVLVGLACIYVGFLVNEIRHFYSVIYLEMTDDGRSSGWIPTAALPNRDIRGIAAAICHGEQFLAEYEDRITVMGGADYARFVCSN